MERKRLAFSDTAAADVDVTAVANYVTFVKLQDLIEVPIEVTKAWIAPSDFDASGKKLCAKVEFIYLDDLGAFLAPEDEEDEGTYQFTTEQKAIMAQVQRWVDAKVNWEKTSVGPLTIAIYGDANKWGNHPMCFAEWVPEMAEEVPQSMPASRSLASRATQPTHRDLGEDSKRQTLKGATTIPSRAPRGRPGIR